MSEKEHADQLIRAHNEFQAKVLPVIFTALTAVAAWLLTRKNDQAALDPSLVLLILTGIACFALLQGAYSYGSTLNYIHYKDTELNDAFKKILKAETAPIQVVRSINAAPAQPALRLAALAITLILVGGTAGLLLAATSRIGRGSTLFPWLVGTWIFFAVAVLSNLLLVTAMRRMQKRNAAGR